MKSRAQRETSVRRRIAKNRSKWWIDCGEFEDSRRGCGPFPSSRNGSEWKQAGGRYGSSLWGVEGAVLESLSCNRGDLCRADASILAGSLARERKSVLLYLCVLAHSRRVWMQICFIKVSGIRRGPNTFKCRRRCWLASQRIWWNAPIKTEGLSCFHPKRKRRASYEDSSLVFFLFIYLFLNGFLLSLDTRIFGNENIEVKIGTRWKSWIS